MPRQAKARYPFEPDYAVPPGATLQETIDALGMGQNELAVRTGLSHKTINQIVKGKAPITPDTSVLLERVTGVSAKMWNNLEANYREQLARIADRERLEADLKWLKDIPSKELIERGAIQPQRDKTSMLQAVLCFFGVSNSEAWNNLWMQPSGAFRKSECFQTKPGPTATWLRLGEIEAQKIETKPFNHDKFKAALDEIRKLTVESPEVFEPKMKELCAEAGVALVFVREVKGCTASGVTRWLTSDKALIQMTLRYRSDDHFWFTFFHEAGHILNDPKKDVNIENDRNDDVREEQANRFAAGLLIPRSVETQLHGLKTATAVKQFAKSINIAPGIIVGRLQKDKIISYSYLNELKRRFEWAAK